MGVRPLAIDSAVVARVMRQAKRGRYATPSVTAMHGPERSIGAALTLCRRRASMRSSRKKTA